MAKKIRDTIHGYIYLTKLEEVISQHELVLRLHYIHQTSFTFLTYPNAHSTRYPHSLGVMHIAGEIFQSALINTPVEVLKNIKESVAGALGDQRLLSVAEEFEQTQHGDHREAFYEAISHGRSQRAVGAMRVPIRGDEDLFVPLVVLFQASRLAAMLHDIGHPPFSHIVEYALLQAAPDKYKGHERVGASLITRMRTDPALGRRSIIAQAPRFTEACLHLCECILNAEDNSLFYGLKKSLISGPIDADRLDYVRRDAYSAGLVPAYDIRRMVDAAFFRMDDEGRSFEVAYRPNCLSSFENFFLARSDLYRYMIYHHDVVRRNISVQKAMVMLIGGQADLHEDAKAMGLKFLSLATGHGRDEWEHYRSFSDATLLNMLWEVDATLPDPEGGPTEDARSLKLFLNVILRRRNDLLRTLIKRPDEYAIFAAKVLKGLGHTDDEAPVPTLNALLKRRLSVIKLTGGDGQEGQDENVAKFQMAFGLEAAMNAAAARLAPGSKAQFHCYYSGTFSAGPGRKVAFSNPFPLGSPRTIAEDISPTVEMLDRAWNFSPHLTIFIHTPGVNTPSRIGAQRDILLNAAVDGMVNYLGQI